MLLRPNGSVVNEAEKRYRSGTTSPEGFPGAMEQNPDEWVEAFVEAAEEILLTSSSSSSSSLSGVRVAAVALSGQMQDVCLVRGGKSIRRALLYSDVRATTEADDIADALGGPERVAAELSNFKGAAACLSKWLWLQRNEPETLRCAEHILLGAHSYLAYVLTNGNAVSCDTTTASTTGILQPPTLIGGGGGGGGGVEPPRWAEDVVSLFDALDPSMLPRLIDGATPAPVGDISRETMEALRLPECLVGVPVFHGVGDLASTTVGAVGLGMGSGQGGGGGGDEDSQGGSSSSPATTYMYLGTSGWIATCKPWSEVLLKKKDKDKKDDVDDSDDGVFRLLHPDGNLAVVAASMVTAGGNAEWARRTLLPSNDASSNTLADLDAAAATAPPGSDGLLYLPHLNGERSPFIDPLVRIRGASPSHVAVVVIVVVARVFFFYVLSFITFIFCCLIISMCLLMMN